MHIVAKCERSSFFKNPTAEVSQESGLVSYFPKNYYLQDIKTASLHRSFKKVQRDYSLNSETISPAIQKRLSPKTPEKISSETQRTLNF